MWNNELQNFILNPTESKRFTFDTLGSKTMSFETIGKLIDFYHKTGQPFSKFNVKILNPIYRCVSFIYFIF